MLLFKNSNSSNCSAFFLSVSLMRGKFEEMRENKKHIFQYSETSPNARDLQSTILFLHFQCIYVVNLYICSVRRLLCTILGSSSKFIRQAELFYHLNNCLSFYGHFGARSMPQQLLAANKVIVYQSRGELSS